MKTLLLSLALCLSAYADNPACHSPGGAIESTVVVSSTAAVTLAPSVGGQDIHLCVIKFLDATATTVTLQGSDATVLDGPDYFQGGSYFLWWDGQISTRRAALGSSLQLKFGTAPANPVAVTIVYYLSPANSSRQ
jgi:hypothetical protein